MRSYGQYCGLARALDAVGDRWSMLIVRELALGDGRYGDVRDGLPGIASNLLADRLRHLISHGLVERYDAPRPVATPLYRLTGRGRDLVPVLHALVRWSTQDMVRGPDHGDHERGRWTAFAAMAYLQHVPPGAAPLLLVLDTAGEPVTIEVDHVGVGCGFGGAADADVRLSGDPWTAMGVLSGALDPDDVPTANLAIATNAARQRFRRLLAANRS